MVYFPKLGSSIDNIRQNADAYLAEIEAEGRDEFSIYLDVVESFAVKNIYNNLGIEAGQVIKWKQPGFIGISLPSLSSKLNLEDVLQAAETEASKTDNRRKLGAVNSSEHHLFVYIDHHNFRAWFAINNTSPANQVPKLPK